MQFEVSLEQFIIKRASVIVEAENEAEAESLATALANVDEVDFEETLLEQSVDGIDRVNV